MRVIRRVALYARIYDSIVNHSKIYSVTMGVTISTMDDEPFECFEPITFLVLECPKLPHSCFERNNVQNQFRFCLVNLSKHSLHYPMCNAHSAIIIIKIQTT